MDWFVYLTPVLLLPVFMLLAFVGCAGILGIEPGIPRQPDPEPEPDPEITFEYPPGLYENPDSTPGAHPLLRRIAWEFDASGLTYEGGGVVSPNFDQDRHRRVTPLDNQANQFPPVQAAGEKITFANLGSPTGGSLTCSFAHNVNNMPVPFDITKNVGDPDFWEWGFNVDLTGF